jgi:hypothetical protein
MFEWFKSKNWYTGKEEQILDAAIREVHPDRFVTDIDAALVIQPILVDINALLGRPASVHEDGLKSG